MSTLPTGDLSAVAAARVVLGEELPVVSPGALAWIRRWTDAGLVDDHGRAIDITEVGVQAGLAARIFDRPGDRAAIRYDRPWQTVVGAFEREGIRYAVSGITACSPTRLVDGAPWPMIYVDSIDEAIAAAQLDTRFVGPRITLLAFDENSATGLVREGGITFVSPAQAMIDAFSGPDRMPEHARVVASRWARRRDVGR